MPGDIFATKGIEYLLTIGYFLLLIALVRYIAPRPAFRPAHARARRAPAAGGGGWFALADGYHYHPGHSWALPDDGAIKVGLDDFTARLVGEPSAIDLPSVGDLVRPGERAWNLKSQGGTRALPMVAPVEGEVVAVNPAVLASPRVATDDPYGAGWLFKVRASRPKASLRNLLSGELASAWLAQTTERMRAMPVAELGLLMPDGGQPVRGFGLMLGPAEWDRMAHELFLAD